MIITKAECLIQKPIDIVFKYLYTLENQTEYNTSIKSAIKNSEAGTSLPTFTIEIDLALFKLTEIYKVKEVNSNQYFIAKCDHSLLSFEDRYDFESIDENTTRVKICDHMELKGLLRLSESIVKYNLSTQMKENLMRVKQNIESKF